MFVAGIDEAGRGPVIGPLVVAMVKIDHRRERQLKSLGVRDSKTLLPIEREWLEGKIREIANFVGIEIITPREIDAGGITQPELDKIVALLRRTDKLDKVVIDKLGGLNSAHTISHIKDKLGNSRLEIICQKKADTNYTIVAAASIIAKVARDEEIKKIYQQTGRVFGSGYPNQKTYHFIKEYKKQYGCLPPRVRKRWKNV